MGHFVTVSLVMMTEKEKMMFERCESRLRNSGIPSTSSRSAHEDGVTPESRPQQKHKNRCYGKNNLKKQTRKKERNNHKRFHVFQKQEGTGFVDTKALPFARP